MATFADVVVEAYRLRLLRSLENYLASLGHDLIAGVDEAGRGALAGPVVAAAVICDPTCLIPGVDDSKALTQKRRAELAERIREKAVAYSVAECSAATVDRLNILQATMKAMRAALASLVPAPQWVLLDAVKLTGLPYPSVSLVRGDRISYSVACASILAKVDRDRTMTLAAKKYPEYGFATHKGYGAAKHLESLREFGPTPMHRLTFRSVVPRLEGVAA